MSIENGGTTICRETSDPTSSKEGGEIIMMYEGEYQENDTIVLSADAAGIHVVLQLDDTLPLVLVYLSNGTFRFPVPFAERRASYNPRSFTGKRHVLYARPAKAEEIRAFRNLALNPYDSHGNTALFPHAEANVETRGESVFAARNAIDGLKASNGHGEWPFTSWGINRDPNARFLLAFGRSVSVSQAIFYLRTDFPHDAWWKSATLRFSDGSSLPVSLRKVSGAQTFEFPERAVEWLTVDELVRAEDDSPFPALTQLEIWGTETNAQAQT